LVVLYKNFERRRNALILIVFIENICKILGFDKISKARK